MNSEPLTFVESMQDGACRIAGLSLLLGLLLWGWFALTLSPIQRYYFSAYVGSSLHRTGSPERDRVVWMLKSRPKDTFEIADPQDLIPAAHGPVPFVLSQIARAQGWTGSDVSVPFVYPAGSQRLFLRQDYFGDRSLFDLLQPPLSLLALPVIVCFAFVFWKHDRDRKRELSWAWVEETSFPEDVWQFTREMAVTSMEMVAIGGRWTARQGRVAVKTWRERGSVSPSPPPSEVHVPQAAESQPVKVQLSRAQTLPFRRYQAEQRAHESNQSGEDAR